MFTPFTYHNKFSINFCSLLLVIAAALLLLHQAAPSEARVYFEEEPRHHNSYSRQWHHIPPPPPVPKNHKNYMKPCSNAEDCPALEKLVCNDYENRCTCSPSSRYEPISRRCIEDRPCSDDNACLLLEENSLCYNSRCQCKVGYAHDYDSDSCLKVGTALGRPVVNSFLAQNIFTIVIISNFLLWLSIFVFILQYIKKRRLAVAAIAAHSAAALGTGSGRSRGRAALPPGMPPPPPAYDNIAFDHGSSYPPPPPYSLNDTQKTDSEAPSPATQTTSVSVISVPSERLSQGSPLSVIS